MTTEQINAAIAEACGWTHPEPPTVTGFMCPPGLKLEKLPPNYCTDLNAMHEAEKTLEVGFDGSPADDYQQALWSVVNPFIPWISSEDNQPLYDVGYLQNFIRATARQRAEALLRTLGKWKE